MPIGWGPWAACRPASFNVGDVFVSSRYYGFYNSAQTRFRTSSESIARARSCRSSRLCNDPYLSLSGVVLDPVNNMLYAAVTTSFNGFGGPGAGSVDGELLEFDPITGQQVATIPLPSR